MKKITEIMDDSKDWVEIESSETKWRTDLQILLSTVDRSKQEWTLQDLKDALIVVKKRIRDCMKSLTVNEGLEKILCKLENREYKEDPNREWEYPWNDDALLEIEDHWDDKFFTKLDEYDQLVEEIGKLDGVRFQGKTIQTNNIRIRFQDDMSIL